MRSTTTPWRRIGGSFVRSARRIDDCLATLPAAGGWRCLPLLLLVCLAGMPSCDALPPAESPYRLLDHAAGRRDVTVELARDLRPVLDPLLDEHAFRLDGTPHARTLRVGLGLTPAGADATWRMQIVLEPPDGAPVTLLDEAIAATTRWRDLSLPLAGHDLRGARLVLRRTRASDATGPHRQAVWANPILLPARPRARPSVILVSLDTLRADRVGPAGASPTRTPRLDALAADGVRYTHAYSPSTWTLPSHVSLLWGRYPSAMERLQARPKDRVKDVLGPVAPIAQRFRDAGWLTAGFTGGGWMSSGLGLAPWHSFGLGFDRFQTFLVPASRPRECAPDRFDGQTVFGWAEAWIREHGDQPFFLFVHTYEAHDRCGIFVGEEEVNWPNDPVRLARLDRHYDDLIRRTDTLLGGLLDTLDAVGIAPDTVVAVTSDHGEALFEHGFGGHGCEMRPYDELVRVPLVVRPAAGTAQPATVDAPVALVQVAPTLLGLAGIGDRAGFDDAPLPGLGLPDGRAPTAVYVHCGDSLAVRGARHKLLTWRTGAHPDEVYDLAADPAERRNIAGTQPEVEGPLRDGARSYWDGAGNRAAGAAVPEIDAETREQLRALGYAQ